MTQTALMSVSGLSKKFGRVITADDISFEVRAGEALGIVGPNGAGKSTLLNLIGGVVEADSGSILFDGRDISRLKAAERAKAGIARSFQIPRPFIDMTVFENVYVGSSFAGRTRGQAGYDRAYHSLEVAGLLHLASTPARQLRLLDRKRLELARALATNPQLILLDEIAGGLTDKELPPLVETIRNLRANGVTVVWIEHIVHALVSVVDRLMCLAEGRILAIGELEERQRAPIIQATEAVAVGAELAEKLVGLAPGGHERHADDVFVEVPRGLHVAGYIGGVVQTRRNLHAPDACTRSTRKTARFFALFRDFPQTKKMGLGRLTQPRLSARIYGGISLDVRTFRAVGIVRLVVAREPTLQDVMGARLTRLVASRQAGFIGAQFQDHPVGVSHIDGPAIPVLQNVVLGLLEAVILEPLFHLGLQLRVDVQRNVVKRRARHFRTELSGVIRVGELEEGQCSAVFDAEEAMAIDTHLAEEFVGFAPSRDQRHPNDVFVKMARRFHVTRHVGGMV